MATPGWTIDELATQVAAALGDGVDQPSRRIRSVPDRRAIRWYTTIGLLDRPRLRGRTGWYHCRHLLQLVAVKRLQAAGLPLAEIQAELAGADDGALRRIARLSDEQLDAAPQANSGTAPTRSRFWSAEPSLSAVPPVSTTSPSADGAEGPRDVGIASVSVAYPQAGVRYAIDLGYGATLLLDHATRILEPEDVATVRRAAQPLLQDLSRCGLVRVVPDEASEGQTR